jgi:predicted nucleic acid-binding protein
LISRLVLVDTNVLLNFALVDRFDLLGALSDLDFRAPAEVMAEILKQPERSRVEASICSGHVGETSLTDVAELVLFSELRQIMGIGEAACLALAVSQRAWIASDEKRVFRREAEARLGPGRILNTPGLLLLGIRRGLLTVEEADRLKTVLETKRFRMKFESFGELV